MTVVRLLVLPVFLDVDIVLVIDLLPDFTVVDRERVRLPFRVVVRVVVAIELPRSLFRRAQQADRETRVSRSTRNLPHLLRKRPRVTPTWGHSLVRIWRCAWVQAEWRMQRGWVTSSDYRAVISVVAQARVDLGISQRELARRLSKPPSYVNKIELLERRLDVLEFIQYAQALGLAPEELLTRILPRLAGDRLDRAEDDAAQDK